MNSKSLLILGAGRFAQDVADWAAEIPGVIPIGFFQDADLNGPTKLDGLPVFSDTQVREHLASCLVVCAIGSPKRATLIGKVADWGAAFATLVHPAARVSRKASIGLGSLVGPMANVAAQSHLGKHVILNRAASIGHHVSVRDYATIGPGAVITGSAVIGQSATIGAGAVVRDGIEVGAGATVGIGSVAVRDVKSGVTVFGIPARTVPST